MPLLKPCRGGVAYSDGQFDDARLNLLARSAEQGGASLRTRSRVVAFDAQPMARCVLPSAKTVLDVRSAGRPQ